VGGDADVQETKASAIVYKTIDPEAFIRQKNQIPDHLKSFVAPYTAQDY